MQFRVETTGQPCGLPASLRKTVVPASFTPMKVLSFEQAQGQLAAIFEEALTGEIIRLQFPSGALIELTPVGSPMLQKPVENGDLMECYNDADWARFENSCGQASD
jgi:hypothetical protein